MKHFTGKRLLQALLLSLLLACCMETTAFAAQYPDVTDEHWAKPYIDRWSDSGILKGYPDGKFHPDDPVTRGQLSAILYSILGVEPVEGYSYPDLAKTAWYYDAVTAMNYYRVTLNTDLNIKPDQPLSREEAIYMIASGFRRADLSRDRMRFSGKAPSDYAQVSDQFTEAVNTMLRLGHVRGGADGRLMPKDVVTRAQVITIINSMFDLYVTQPGTYHLTCGQNALITCPNVTILMDNVASREGSNIYLSAKADKNVVIANDGGTESAYVSFFATQKGENAWTLRGNVRESMVRTRTLSQSQSFDGRYAAGFGFKSHPYLITTADQFALLAQRTDTLDQSVYFKLAADLALPDGMAPLSSADGAFPQTNLDGGGHSVTYRIQSRSYSSAGGGLFYGWHGPCENLTVKGTMDLTLSEKAVQEGSGKLYFGGFAAYLDRELTNCTADMDICVRYEGGSNVDLNVGGLAGFTQAAQLTGCTAAGTVKAVLPQGVGDAHVGGLVGGAAAVPFASIVSQGSMTGCGSTGTVAAEGGYQTAVGGVAGLVTYLGSSAPTGTLKNDGILNCWSTARLSAVNAGFQSDCGGIVGQLNYGTLSGCWAKPVIALSGPEFSNAGGIAGACYEGGTLSDCWVNGTGLPSGGGVRSGGIVGRLRGGAVANSFALGTGPIGTVNAIAFAAVNDGSVSGSADLTGPSAAQRAAFLGTCGWDFVDTWEQTGGLPLLKNMDSVRQRAAQA